ncbi:ribose 5-phosphate isomerase B [Clostridium psychrophilum]|uniref:ribose 5-phosphate isomerase B n=1 Tax=Clostridium psychrophilum TaxID=132926 RepID=UPI001C0C13B7|nr:ribose 5-phosphate isomerase B [Clostridium psychrophilum]MBU3182272.1 ribose 5-phosphate isomerase B [Clostridium psychrophilum]
MKIAIGNDHAGLLLKNFITNFLKSKGIEVIDYGTNELCHCYSAPIAEMVTKSILCGKSDRGILICGTGVGMSIAANKFKGIRCVVCSDPYTAQMSRSHNNTNILAIGARVLGSELAQFIVEIWVNTDFEAGKRINSYNLISEIENKNFK